MKEQLIPSGPARILFGGGLALSTNTRINFGSTMTADGNVGQLNNEAIEGARTTTDGVPEPITGAISIRVAMISAATPILI